MELAEQIDPERWHRILERFFELLTEGVHRFEGTVNQYTGDGIMALFGAPIALEDHAQRACYAALSLRDALESYAEELRLSRGLDFAVRIGIHTGEVVVGRIGDDLRMDYTAQGQSVGLAQRLEQMAGARSIYLSDATAGLVAGYLELRDLGEATAKGLADPIRVFELVGPGRHRTRLDVSRSRGLTRFVGRHADLGTLEAALEQACAGDGQVVWSRRRESGRVARASSSSRAAARAGSASTKGTARRTAGPPRTCRSSSCCAGSSGSANATATMWPAARSPASWRLRARASIRCGRCSSTSSASRDPEHAAPPLPPEMRQRQLAGFLRHLVQARSARQPRVLFIDDAHWIDAASDALLAQLIEAVPGTRTLVLVNFRPEYQAEWMGRSGYRQIPLLPLGRAGTEELLADLLGRDSSLAGLAKRIHERTRGNPFFVEEVVLSLVESGSLEGARGAHRMVEAVHELEIPDGVHAVLAARIDRLPEREKRLLQTAAVIGREAPGSVLERVAELPEAELASALAALVQGEFLFEQALYPEAEYAFKHPLTHEVAYRSQLGERRAVTHAAVATALEELSGERLDERAALLAHHWEAAGEPLVAARWHHRAGERGAGALSDPHGTVAHWRRARALLADTSNTAERSELELDVCRKLLTFLAWFGGEQEEMAALFERGVALAEARDDLRVSSQLHIHYGVWRGFTGEDMAGFGRHAREAADLAEQVGEEGVALASAAGLALVSQCEGRVREAIAVGRRALERAPSDPTLGAAYWSGSAPGPWLHGFTRCTEGLAGRPLEALADLEELARSLGSAPLAMIGHLWAAQLAELLGDGAGAMAHALAILAATEKRGVELNGAGPYFVGIAQQLEGRSQEAASSLEHALAIHERTGGAPMEPGVCSWSRLAVAYADLGRTEHARETSLRGLAWVRERLPVFVPPALTMHAAVLRKTGGALAREAIEAALTEAGELVERIGVRSWQPFVHVERAELAGVVGDPTTRERELREAHRLFSEMGAAGHVERLDRQLGA